MCLSLCPTNLLTNPRVAGSWKEAVEPLIGTFWRGISAWLYCKYFLFTNMAGRTACNSGEGNGEKMLVWWFLLSILLYVLTRGDHPKEPNDVFKYPVDCPALEMVATILFVEGILAQNKNQHSVCSIILRTLSPSYSPRSKDNNRKTATMFHNFPPKKNYKTLKH